MIFYVKGVIEKNEVVSIMFLYYHFVFNLYSFNHHFKLPKVFNENSYFNGEAKSMASIEKYVVTSLALSAMFTP